MVVSQIQDPALMLGTDSARVGLGEVHGTNPSSNLLVDMLQRNWCRLVDKKSPYGSGFNMLHVHDVQVGSHHRGAGESMEVTDTCG